MATESTVSDRTPAASRAMRNVAGGVVMVSGLVAVVMGPSAVWLVRDQLHINCSMGQPGSEGADTWMCSDGIGYLGVAAVLGLMWFLAIVLGTLVAMLVRRDRAARLLLVLLAGASTVWILAWTWYGSSALVYDDYAPMTGQEYWVVAVGPAAVAGILGLAAGLVSTVLSGPLSQIAGIVAVVGLTIATVLQPGLSINTIPAVGLLAATALRGRASLR